MFSERIYILGFCLLYLEIKVVGLLDGGIGE